jgi:acyl-coenzyme A synthetase/AMP-(fatty) acid ligase
LPRSIRTHRRGRPAISVTAHPRILPPSLDPDGAFVADGDDVANVARFRAHAAALAGALTAARKVVNLCANRYRFLVAFAAAVLRGTTTLLPSSHAASAIEELAAGYPGCDTIDDARVASCTTTAFTGPPGPDTDFIAAIGHTSGSTGVPSAHAKTWASLGATTALNAATIRAALGSEDRARQPWIVATVPPQHMYGLETSVLLPLLAGFGIHAGKPLLPADVAAALADVPPPRILVSTPVHLGTLIDSTVQFPETAIVLSATAPLQQELARRIERRLGATLVELFGSTETCVVATRRTATEDRWRAYPDIRLEPVEHGTIVSAPWLPREQLLHDVIELRDDNSFTIVGRRGDIVEFAGKRASLADLTRRLAALPGVQDAVVFQPPAEAGGRALRCAALVVAPGLTPREIARRFRAQVDALFVPRPLLVVPALPRNELGKLPLDRLLGLLAAARGR